VIDAKALTARHGGVELQPTTLTLAAGRHALLGRKEDGVALLLACLAGEVRPKRGALTVLGEAPWSWSVRARVGWVPLAPKLPDVLRVDETIALARRIRKNAPVAASAVLAPLGLEALAPRRVDTLDPSEARAVALAEVIAAPSVSVILVEEPFVSMAAPAAGAMASALAARKNTCLVFSTASAYDASMLAEDFALFDRGRLLRVVSDAPLRATRDVARMLVVADDARALAAELAKKPEIARLELGAHGIVVEGAEPRALAEAVNAAIVDARVDVRRIELEPASIEDLRKDALAQIAAAQAQPPQTPTVTP
jgi:ABC-type multidrug transport system ATPase subunit